MKIISHRGYWQNPTEKNTIAAFKKSFALGFGTETDVRDYCGKLVISHDIPTHQNIDFEDFLELASSYSSIEKPLSLAINIKADGLADLIAEKIRPFSNLDIFAFDMSVPDMLSYRKNRLNFFTRLSDIEPECVLFDSAQGVWLDGFNSTWYTTEVIEELLNSEKNICIVSPELHGRPYEDCWSIVKAFQDYGNLMLCTDFPEEAKNFMERS